MVTWADERIDQAFRALPLGTLADAALGRAGELGAAHADVRVERIQQQGLVLRDGQVSSANDALTLGLAVRVIVDGTWGFASTHELSADAAAATAARAVQVARTLAALNREPVARAEEPVYGERSWVSAYEIDPFTVPTQEKIAVLAEWSARLLAADGVAHVDAACPQVKENKFYADLAGTSTIQQRIRIEPRFTATAVDRAAGAFETMRTLAPPAGRGWEYALGRDGGWGFDDELDRVPELLAEKMTAPSVEPGRYDLVVDPSNLWLTIHESVGHATEYDRAIGYEAAYAGTSFATPDQLGSLRYGSELMHVTGDRTVPHRAGHRRFRRRRGGHHRVGSRPRRGAGRLPAGPDVRAAAGAGPVERLRVRRLAAPRADPADGQRVPATRSAPGHQPGRPDRRGRAGDLRGRRQVVVDRHAAVQLPVHRAAVLAIEHGRLAGQLRDVAYQATTTDFWGSLRGLGGASTWVLGGALNCGKAQPGQVAAVSHGCPAALFEQVNVLNTAQEAGK